MVKKKRSVKKASGRGTVAIGTWPTPEKPSGKNKAAVKRNVATKKNATSKSSTKK